MKRLLAIAAVLSFATPANAAAPELSEVKLPFLWSEAGLGTVAVDVGGGAWIGGAQGKYCIKWADFCAVSSPGNPVLRHREGTFWKEYPLNGWNGQPLNGQGQIAKVVSSGAETWVMGTDRAGYPGTYVARFDGKAFQPVTLPVKDISSLYTSPAGTFITYYEGLDSRLAKRTGTTWTEIKLPDLFSPYDVQGLAGNDLWSVGGGSGGASYVQHFDGKTWTSTKLNAGLGDEFVSAIAPVTSKNVWALSNLRLLHWTGSAWTGVNAPAGTDGLSDLAVDASGTPWVTLRKSGSATGLPYRYVLGAWEPVKLPAGVSVGDLAAAPGGGVWGVGAKGNAPTVVN
ncbi:hypothetical protein [Actinocorallia longicatena]